MNRFDKKFVIIVALLILTGSFSWRVYFKKYAQADSVSIHAFPQEIEGWVSEEMPITEEEYAILETRNAFARKYRSSDGKEVYLFIVYSQNNRKVSHPPEICYTGGGVTILGKKADQLALGQGQVVKTVELTLELGSYRQISHYWFKVGDTFTANYWKQQLLIAVKTILGQSTSSALIRLSAIIYQNDREKTKNDIEKFAQATIPSLNKYLP